MKLICTLLKIVWNVGQKDTFRIQTPDLNILRLYTSGNMGWIGLVIIFTPHYLKMLWGTLVVFMGIKLTETLYVFYIENFKRIRKHSKNE